jgi:hypothetical protein
MHAYSQSRHARLPRNQRKKQQAALSMAGGEFVNGSAHILAARLTYFLARGVTWCKECTTPETGEAGSKAAAMEAGLLLPHSFLLG